MYGEPSLSLADATASGCIRLLALGEVFKGRGDTALNLTRENWLKDFARNAREESRAASIGAMWP